MAHDDRIKDLNENANVLVEGGMFDSDSIRLGFVSLYESFLLGG